MVSKQYLSIKILLLTFSISIMAIRLTWHKTWFFIYFFFLEGGGGKKKAGIIWILKFYHLKNKNVIIFNSSNTHTSKTYPNTVLIELPSCFLCSTGFFLFKFARPFWLGFFFFSRIRNLRLRSWNSILN